MSEVSIDQSVQNNTESAEGQEATQQSTEQVNPGDQTEGKTILTSDQDAKQTEVLAKAPEVYADFSVPEGISIDTDLMGKFNTLAKDVNLSQDNAQKLVDLVSENTKSLTEKGEADFIKTRDEWINNLKKDPDFGGEKFNETIERAKRAVNKFGSKDLLQFLDKSGYGDNAELLKMFARVDRLVGEDKLVDGKPSGFRPKSSAEVLYPNQGN